MDLVNDTMRALAFLSRLPVPQRWFEGYDGALSSTVRGFPLAGMLIALPASLVLLIAHALDLPEIVTASLVVVALIITTGALHEDGLADVADGFYGGTSIDRRLEIMKDSATGSYGVLALIISVFLRTALLTTILDEVGVFHAVVVVIGTEAASRSVMAKFWQSLPSARAGGVSDQSGMPTAEAANFALILGAVVLAISYGTAGGPLAIVIAACLTALVFPGFSWLCHEKIGGQTGDTLGAMQQLTTISLLLGLVIAL
ncbi:adenosylcobinamide-GDP ribazoletransferase [Phyllobacterium sp. LjRoot231]|uniref:adenosylcobinamide-GDP ribazoletransferase n=1 Tax=Phyllobacterium sp. LjRoot231 TaxID=3342289 RepID=UPI003ECCCB23